MDAIEFLREGERMCDYYQYKCEDCPLGDKMVAHPCNSRSDHMEREAPDKLVEIIETWSKEHPRKTRQSEFLKLFPTAEIDDNGVIIINPCSIDSEKYSKNSELCSKYQNCYQCRRDYWFTEIK